MDSFTPALSKKYDEEDSDTKKVPALSKKYDEDDSNTKKEPALSKKYDEEDSDTKKDPSFILPQSKIDHSYPLMVREECIYTHTPLHLVEQNDFKDELTISAVDMEEIKATKSLRHEVKDATELCEKDSPLKTVPKSGITSEGTSKVRGVLTLESGTGMCRDRFFFFSILTLFWPNFYLSDPKFFQIFVPKTFVFPRKSAL